MLILVRHGESAWNASDRFSGWADVALTATGRTEATRAGRWLRNVGIGPTIVHTSMLSRAINTADLILDACERPGIPCLRTARLNERHYGLLQGMRRAEAEEIFGPAQVALWRRGIDHRPPLDGQGRGESLADLRIRLWPYVDSELLPSLDAGETVLVVAHGNTIRMLRQLLEGLSDERAARIEVPTGRPSVYRDVAGFLRAST